MAFDKDSVGGNVLGIAITDSQGAWRITYREAQFHKSNKECGGADLILRLYDQATKGNEIPLGLDAFPGQLRRLDLESSDRGRPRVSMPVRGLKMDRGSGVGVGFCVANQRFLGKINSSPYFTR